jgi:hypothetical protein
MVMAGLGLAMLAGAALAEAPTAFAPIRLGQVVSGALKPGDRLEPDGTYFDAYVFDGKAGQSVVIEMRSADVDSVVGLYPEDGDGALAINDNANRRGRDAKLEVVLPRSQRYLVVANTAEPGDVGAYQLSVRAGKPVAAVRPSARPILPGKAVQGELSDRSGRAGDASLYDLYRFRGKAGETLRANLASRDFEPFVSVRQAGQATDLAFARDRGHRSAELAVTLPADGDYEVWANAATAGERGRYTLWLGRDGEAATPEVRRIAYGDTVRGELTPSDAKAPDSSFYDVYRFKAARGDEITVTMRSPMLEAYLAVRVKGAPKELATAADDGYGGRDAELTFVAPADGDYEVVANTLSAGQHGQYVISIECIGRRSGQMAQNP